MAESDEKWWLFINWLWEMCRSGQRTWEHPRNEEEVFELRAHFEENCPGWRRGDCVKSVPAQKDELPGGLPF